jgi:hypothetical protein
MKLCPHLWTRWNAWMQREKIWNLPSRQEQGEPFKNLKQRSIMIVYSKVNQTIWSVKPTMTPPRPGPRSARRLGWAEGARSDATTRQRSCPRLDRALLPRQALQPNHSDPATTLLGGDIFLRRADSLLAARQLVSHHSAQVLACLFQSSKFQPALFVEICNDFLILLIFNSVINNKIEIFLPLFF